MRAFTYERPNSPGEAAASSAKPGAKIIAGGTNLLDLMKLQVETPAHLVDVNRLDLARIDDASLYRFHLGMVRQNVNTSVTSSEVDAARSGEVETCIRTGIAFVDVACSVAIDIRDRVQISAGRSGVLG